MLIVIHKGQSFPIENRRNFNIVHDYEGELTLSFDVRTNDKLREYLKEEAIIKYDDNFFLIKKVNQRKVVTSLESKIDMDVWKDKMWLDYNKTYALFSEVVLDIIPKGWVIEGVGSVTGRKATHMEGATSYDILMNCKKLYNIVFEYHTASKVIKVIKPDVVQSRGLYVTDELNLKELEFKGDSSSVVTRLYARGKKIEERDEEGNIISVSYVDFADINNGKKYVDNANYKENIVSAYWQDDRYTDSQSLLNDAIDKLKVLANPDRSYGCKIVDHSRINDKYKILDFKMYDKVTLMDSVSSVYVQHQIVQYKYFPDNPSLNEVVLSSAFKKITGTIDGIKQSVSNIDTEIKRSENTINEIIRDVASNSLRINNTYTKGDIDVKEESIIQQTSDMIDVSITEIAEQNDAIVENANKLQLAVDSLTNQFITTGGNNLLKDSFGAFYDGWVYEKKYHLNTSIDIQKRNDYGVAILLVQDTIMQTVQLPDGEYTLSFTYCKHVSLSDVKVIIDDVEYTLINTDYTKFEHKFTAKTASFKIQFRSDTDDSCSIVNLMLNKGNSAAVWSLSQGESYSENFQLSKQGMMISNNISNTALMAKNDKIGFINKSTGEYTTTFTDVGILVKDITVKNKMRLLSLLYQEVNGQVGVFKMGSDN